MINMHRLVDKKPCHWETWWIRTAAVVSVKEYRLQEIAVRVKRHPGLSLQPPIQVGVVQKRGLFLFIAKVRELQSSTLFHGAFGLVLIVNLLEIVQQYLVLFVVSIWGRTNRDTNVRNARVILKERCERQVPLITNKHVVPNECASSGSLRQMFPLRFDAPRAP